MACFAIATLGLLAAVLGCGALVCPPRCHHPHDHWRQAPRARRGRAADAA